MTLSSKDLLAQVKSTITEISVENFQKKHKTGAVLVLDVREPDEVAQGQIPGAQVIPRGFLELKIEDVEANRQHPIVVYCAGGNRSALAAESLKRMGYQNVQSLIGGFAAWKSNGGEVAILKQLSAIQKNRYHRHTLLPEIKEQGQLRLLEAKVALVGAGGLGCPAALYLAAAGVGTLGLIDDDVVDASNLQRQILYAEADVGKPKVDCAQARLRGLNPDVQVIPHRLRLSRANALEVLRDYDIVLNGCDNFPTRYLINDAAYFLKKPLVDGSIFRFEGQCSIHLPDVGPCYRCLYPEPPPPDMAPSCAEAGVLGVLPGIIGSLQAIETIKLILGLGQSLVGRLLMFDAKALNFREMKLRRDPDCPLCGTHRTVTELIDYEGFCRI